MARILFQLIAVLAVFNGAFGLTALTVTTSKECTHGTPAIPSGSGVTVVMTCDMTPTLTDILGDSTASVAFKEGTDIVFELPAATTTLATTSVTFKASQSAVTEGSATISAADVSGSLQITITNFPADANTATWTCTVEDSDTAAPAGANADRTEAGQAAPLDLNAFCKDFTSAQVSPCDNFYPSMTCTTGSVQLDQWEADPTAVLNWRISGTVKYSLSASNIAAAATSGNLDNSAGTWSATAAAATAVTIYPNSMDTADITSTAWTCDITGATGSFNGAAAVLTTTACPAYTVSATCSGTTVTALSLSTPTLTFSIFDTTDSYTITVSKGTEERYKLTSSTISSAALTGNLDAASGTIVAGTYTVASTSATTWTFDPTVDITEADEGSDWYVVVSGGATYSGGSIRTSSITCGAETNKIAGLLVALLVVMKTLLF